MILRVSSLNAWIDKNFIKEFYNKGCESLIKVYMKLVKPPKTEIKNIRQKEPSTSSDINSNSSFLDDLFEDDEQNEQLIEESHQSLRYEKVQLEINKLRNLFLEKKYQITETNSQFWRNNERSFPELYKLAIIILNIQSSSSFVERFFSICGVVCKKRATNMKNKLIIMRSMMKANFHLLNILNNKS
jgi:hypothetical protein